MLRPVTDKYHSLGVQLGMSVDKIHTFEQKSAGNCSVEECLQKMLSLWLRKGDCQLDTLVSGVTAIGYKRLADDLKNDYTGRFSVSVCVCVCLSLPEVEA